MAEAKASGEEPSMEEILQSIKKIIAEDDTGAKPADSAAKVNGNGAHADIPGSDVLELTEMVAEEPAAAPMPAPAPAAPAAMANDVLSKIDEALAVDAPPAAAAPANTMLSDQAAQAASQAFKKLQTAAEPPIPAVHTTPSPVLASGKSVEEMVMDMLKPMMKDWLDRNLPSIVERIVTIEIRKLTK